MARTHNPFAPKEASRLETPWGVFEVASPNKSRLAAMRAVQLEVEKLGDDVSENLGLLAGLAINACATGLVDGDTFAEAAEKAWDADEVTLAELQGAAGFVSDEIQGGAAEGND